MEPTGAECISLIRPGSDERLLAVARRRRRLLFSKVFWVALARASAVPREEAASRKGCDQSSHHSVTVCVSTSTLSGKSIAQHVSSMVLTIDGQSRTTPSYSTADARPSRPRQTSDVNSLFRPCFATLHKCYSDHVLGA